MRLTTSQRRRAVTVLGIAVAGALIGLGYSYVLYLISDEPYAWENLYRGVAAGALISGFSSGVELFWLGRRSGAWLRRMSLWKSLVIRTVIHAVIAVVSIQSVIAFHAWMNASSLDQGRALADQLMGRRPDGLPGLFRDLVFSFIVISFFIALLEVRRLIGARTLANLLRGRYHRPRKEGRIFVFIDLVGSTGLAVHLGDEGFHAFLSRFFFDIDEIIVDHGGEVHSYVGDAVIATWPLSSPQRNARAVEAVMAIGAWARQARPAYLRQFGHAPAFRAAIHGGMVVAGECGDSHMAITYLGDVVNTTARMELAAKDLDCPVILSKVLADRMDLPQSVAVEDLGKRKMRGVANPMHLLGLSPKV